MVESVEAARHEEHCPSNHHIAVLEYPVEGGAIEQLEHHIGKSPIGDAVVEDRHCTGVLEPGCELSLTDKALSESGESPGEGGGLTRHLMSPMLDPHI